MGSRPARIAQLVEPFHGKEGVTSSSLVPGFSESLQAGCFDRLFGGFPICSRLPPTSGGRRDPRSLPVSRVREDDCCALSPLPVRLVEARLNSLVGPMTRRLRALALVYGSPPVPARVG